MKKKDELIYDLIFSKEDQYIIDVGDYIINICDYVDFIDDVKQILKKSKVIIISNSINVNNKGVIWKLKVRK